MPSDNKSSSFTFHRNVFGAANNQNENASKLQNCRKRLQDSFDRSGESTSARSDRSVLSVISLNDTRKVLRTSTERISKTFNNFRTSFGTFSQVRTSKKALSSHFPNECVLEIQNTYKTSSDTSGRSNDSKL